MTNKKTEGTKQQIFQIQKIYIKDASLESPVSPSIFTKEFTPSLNVELNIDSNALEDNIYQVILRVTTTTRVDDEVAFLCEVEQAGIFVIKDFSNKELAYLLGAKCPDILFPYAREFISDIVVRAGFPPLLLEPANFDAMYNGSLERTKQQTQ